MRGKVATIYLNKIIKNIRVNSGLICKEKSVVLRSVISQSTSRKDAELRAFTSKARILRANNDPKKNKHDSKLPRCPSELMDETGMIYL